MRPLAVLVGCLLVAAAIPGAVVGQDVVSGSPDISVHVADDELAVGQSTVELQLVNRGELQAGSSDDRPTVATGVTVSASGEGPITVETDTVATGAVTTRAPATAPIRVTVPEDVEPGTYDLDVEVSYAYTGTIIRPNGGTVEKRATERFDVTLRVPDEPRFAVTDVETDAQVGGDGSLFVTLRNEGTESATDARVGVRSTSSGAAVGSGQGEAPTRAFAGTLDPGESTTLEYDASVSAPERFSAEATVTYENADGLTRQSDTIAFGVEPRAEQTFSVDDVETTLSVGSRGNLTGVVTNEGPTTVDDAVLVATTGSNRIDLGEGQYALPDLEPGESATFSYDAEVSGQADPGPRQFGFVVEYTSGGADARSDRQTARVDVAPPQPDFEIDAAETLEAGSSTTLTVEVTNNREETLSDITANLYADSPLRTGTDESFVDELGPGESTTVEFELSVAGSAMPNTYAVEMDFQYTDSRGDDQISEVYQEPIEVTESSSDGDGSLSPLLVVVAVGLVLLVGRRRR
ncbi:COG1361 S-layer family protein [Natronomonas marina]|uniref:COG1361 S-layer family protein n=1 Tax=Natronomonas marina TaxID=2961939 RepID=UPI0020C9FEEC|nr:CARDB domain-containing protein [Natronomonas marina]